jgi:predicted dehydrogenase
MPTRDGKLVVGVHGVGWCASQHIAAFQRNPHTSVTWLGGRDADRTRANLKKYGLVLPDARITTRYEDLLAAPDVDIISITTPNHLHAEQAVAAAAAGKHFMLEKPTGLDAGELVRIRDAVRRSGVRTIVSFELHYNPFLRFARWLRVAGWLGEIRFARTQYLSHVTDWYSGRSTVNPVVRGFSLVRRICGSRGRVVRSSFSLERRYYAHPGDQT